MAYESAYEIGDIVEIVSANEYRARGGSCTDNCAIARYGGSICEVTRVGIAGVDLSPLEMHINFESEDVRDINDYTWKFMSVKRYDDEIFPALSNEFDLVFS